MQRRIALAIGLIHRGARAHQEADELAVAVEGGSAPSRSSSRHTSSDASSCLASAAKWSAVTPPAVAQSISPRPRDPGGTGGAGGAGGAGGPDGVGGPGDGSGVASSCSTQSALPRTSHVWSAAGSSGTPCRFRRSSATSTWSPFAAMLSGVAPRAVCRTASSPPAWRSSSATQLAQPALHAACSAVQPSSSAMSGTISAASCACAPVASPLALAGRRRRSISSSERPSDDTAACSAVCPRRGSRSHASAAAANSSSAMALRPRVRARYSGGDASL
eukprot:4452370-Prymnesium_polylepis.2